MERVTVLYHSHDDGHFDMDYYLKRHMPKVCKLLGSHLIRCSIGEGIKGENGAVPVIATASIYVDSHEAFRTMLQAHGTEVLADVKNYTNIKPVICYEKIHEL